MAETTYHNTFCKSRFLCGLFGSSLDIVRGELVLDYVFPESRLQEFIKLLVVSVVMNFNGFYFIFVTHFVSFLRTWRSYFVDTRISCALCIFAAHTTYHNTVYKSRQLLSILHTTHNRAVMLVFFFPFNDNRLSCAVLGFIIFVNDFT